MSEKKKSIDEWIADGTLYPIGSLIIIHYESGRNDYHIVKEYSNLQAPSWLNANKRVQIKEIWMTVKCLQTGQEWSWFFANTTKDHTVLRAPTY